MGNSWSQRHDFYVHQFNNPRAQHLTQNMIVRMEAREGKLVNVDENTSPFSHLVSAKDTSQHAVLLGIDLLTVKNEHSCAITIHLDDVSFICPAGFSGTVDENNRIVYRNVLPKETINLYAGLNQAILDETAEENGYECFEEDHPVPKFIKLHGAKIDHKPMAGDVLVKEKYTLIRRSFLDDVRKYAQSEIFDKIVYTRFENTELKGNMPLGYEDSRGSVTFSLQIDYILVNVGIPRLVEKTIYLK